MGKIAELIEKKAEGTITEAELKELNTLLAESKALGTDDVTPTVPAGDEPNEDEEVEKLAQSLADSVTAKIDPILKALEEKKPTVEKTHDKKFIVDKVLGKKTPEELAEIKVEITSRKSAGKKITEVTAKTVHFVEALVNNNVEKLQILSEGTAADGGYLVPDEFANMIVEDIRDLNVMRQIATVMSTNSDTLHLPSLAGRPKAAWRAEKAVKATSTANFGEQVFTPYSLAVIVGLTNELVADASLGVNGSIVDYVAGLMAQSLAEKEEEAFWTGDGSGKPTGITQYSLRDVAITSGTAGDAIRAAFMRTPQGYRNRGVYVGNSVTLERVANLKDSQGNYLLSRLADGVTQTLAGRPYYEVNFLSSGTLLFGDFSYYTIVDREGVSVRVSDEATVAGSSAFEKNLTYVRVEKRVDGELTLPAAITKVTNLT